MTFDHSDYLRILDWVAQMSLKIKLKLKIKFKLISCTFQVILIVNGVFFDT